MPASSGENANITISMSPAIAPSISTPTTDWLSASCMGWVELMRLIISPT